MLSAAKTDGVLNVSEAAQYLRVHQETLRRLARNGEIPAYKVGRGWRFNRSTLDRWAESQGPIRERGRVLVVDDDEDVRDTLARALEDEGYGAASAATGPEALELVRREVPDVVLLDLKLPGMGGPEVLKEIRKRHPDLPVVIVTGYPDSDLMAEAMRYSPLLLLPKPVEPQQVLEAVSLALGGSKSSRRGT